MLKKKIVIPIIILIGLGFSSWALLKNGNSENTTFTFAEIEKGDIQNTVSATGTIEPVTTVEVGTQVSGIINKIYVDFNDRVKKNQLMAVIDTTILSVQVSDAKANLVKSQAEFDKAQYNYERTEKLFKQNLLSELEYITAKSTYESAKSSLLSAKNSLERADLNMRYAFIRSPINGTVIYREVEEGQTVASSFQTPELFLIAEDLSKMEIHALVDESEIGLIKVGQPVEFEVQAFDDKKFTGTVRQVWLQPETVQNVVNYTVVVDAENPDGLLLPGMTATIDFIVESKEDVLLVPVSATKVTPTQKMMDTIAENMRKQFEKMQKPGNSANESRSAAGGNGSNKGGATGSFTMPNNIATLWYLDKDQELRTIPVTTGSNDGKNIEITPLPTMPGMSGPTIKAGMKVIKSIETTEQLATQNSMPGPPGGGFGGRPPF